MRNIVNIFLKHETISAQLNAPINQNRESFQSMKVFRSEINLTDQ